MKRRDFLKRSGSVVLLASTPVAVATAMRGSLLDDPLAWIGTTFTLDDGVRLELAKVESLAGEGLSQQLRLHFRTAVGRAPSDGTHTLTSAWGVEPLFLQTGVDGPVACVNRLLHGV